MIFGLGNIIEARIVHDGRRMSMFFYPGFIAQLFYRHR